MGSNTEKKPWTNLQSKRLRATTKWGAIEKSSILEKLPVLKANKKFDGSNNIFFDCTYKERVRDLYQKAESIKFISRSKCCFGVVYAYVPMDHVPSMKMLFWCSLCICSYGSSSFYAYMDDKKNLKFGFVLNQPLFLLWIFKSLSAYEYLDPYKISSSL